MEISPEIHAVTKKADWTEIFVDDIDGFHKFA